MPCPLPDNVPPARFSFFVRPFKALPTCQTASGAVAGQPGRSHSLRWPTTSRTGIKNQTSSRTERNRTRHVILIHSRGAFGFLPDAHLTKLARKGTNIRPAFASASVTAPLPPLPLVWCPSVVRRRLSTAATFDPSTRTKPPAPVWCDLDLNLDLDLDLDPKSTVRPPALLCSFHPSRSLLVLPGSRANLINSHRLSLPIPGCNRIAKHRTTIHTRIHTRHRKPLLRR